MIASIEIAAIALDAEEGKGEGVAIEIFCDRPIGQPIQEQEVVLTFRIDSVDYEIKLTELNQAIAALHRALEITSLF